MVSRLSCSITFAGVEVKLSGLRFPRASFLSFLREGMTSPLFRFSKTSLTAVPFSRAPVGAAHQALWTRAGPHPPPDPMPGELWLPKPHPWMPTQCPYPSPGAPASTSCMILCGIPSHPNYPAQEGTRIHSPRATGPCTHPASAPPTRLKQALPKPQRNAVSFHKQFAFPRTCACCLGLKAQVCCTNRE